MISFESDYNSLAVQEIIDAFTSLGDVTFTGYGLDEISERARNKIKKYLGREDVDVHFLVGGTQANQVMIDTMLKAYQAVAAVDSGHINVHEAGAIESTGHKIEALPNHNGKMSAEDLEELLSLRVDEHMVSVGAVYISNSTEVGTIYTKEDLKALRKVCDENGLYLYMDGARLGDALTCRENDLTLSNLAQYCDCFYIGATKNGGILGEAMVIVNDDLKPHFRNTMKMHGGLLAKGFVAGIQYDCLFTDDLFFKVGRHENEMADLLRAGLKEMGCEFFIDSPTNQLFPILPNDVIEELLKDFAFIIWEKGKEKSPIRLVCSFRTNKGEIESFLARCRELMR